MLLLGTLSVLQLILLPGLLLIRVFPGQRSPIQQASFVFVLSLLANYIVVALLAAGGVYYRSVVFVLFALEVAALAWVYRRHWLAPAKPDVKRIKTRFNGYAKSLSEWIAKDYWTALLYIACTALAVLTAAWVLYIWVTNFGTVFEAWDSWASWDRWAEHWAANRIPGDTWEYPQLIPILLSISYKFIGTVAVKFFGKSIMPLFVLLIVLTLIELGRRFRSFGYMLGAVLAAYSLYYLLPRYFIEVYVDIPVASLSLLAVATLLAARTIKDARQLKTLLLLGSLTTALATVTKQTGAYILAFYPLLAYWWVLRERKDFTLRSSIQLLAKHMLLVVLIVAPWYAFVQYNIMAGNRVSNIQYVISDIYAGQTYWERFVIALKGLNWYAYWFGFMLLSLPVLSKPLRQLAVLVVLPFSILWAVFLSYEYRNLAIALPLLSLVNGAAVEAWFVRLRDWFSRTRSKKLARKAKPGALAPVTRWLLTPVGIVAMLLLGVGLLSLRTRGEDLIVRQINLERQMFNPAVNERLYNYLGRTNGPEPIITHYQVGWLPDLEGTWRNERFNNFETFQKTLADNPDASLLLVPSWAAPEIWDFINKQIEANLYEIQFVQDHLTLIRMLDRYQP